MTKKDLISPSSLANNIVAKSNLLIRASYKLTLQEQRLILIAISKLDSRKMGIHPKHDQSKVNITTAEFAETFDIDIKYAYKEMREATNQLFERRITEIDGKKTSKMRWVEKVEYHDGEGWSELVFSQTVLPLLTLLRQQYTSYTLKRVAGLRSIYSIRIFELCAQFQDSGMLRIRLDELIALLDCPYVRYVDVVRRVIQPSVDELEAKSNMSIKWRGIKEGRAVKTIEFLFEEQAQQKLDL